MKTALRRLILSALTLASLGIATTLPAAAAERGPRAKAALPAETEARVIVKFKADSELMRALSASGTVRPQHAQTLSGRLGLSLRDGRVLDANTQVMKGTGLTSRQLADRLSAQTDVEYAVVDGRVRAFAAPNDPLYPTGQTGATVPAVGQWYLRAPNATTITSASSVLSSINAEAAWAITTGSASVVVAVLDTGVRFDHPDLTTKLVPGYDFITDLTTAKDGDARDDDASDPGDYGCGETTSSWHGTQTAGLIGAATNNGVGMAGVGYNVKVLPVRVLGCGGTGYDSDIQAAMLWAAGIHVVGVPDNTTPAKVLNLSLGGTGACNSAYQSVVNQVLAQGAVIVVAAGNDGLDVGTPANCAGAIAVGGVRQSGTKVGYSDLGPSVSIAAPAGNCVNDTNGPCLYPLLSTSNSGTTTPVAGAAGAIYTGDGDDASLGTSFSAPLVAGTAALMYSANPSLTPAQVLSALKSSARAFPSTSFDTTVKACVAPSSVAQSSECFCTTSTCGAGLLDAGAAVAAVAAVAGVSANITTASNTTVAGSSVTFDGSTSRSSAGISTYLWTITPATGLAAITSATNAPTMTLLTSAAGSLTVTLTVTDAAGKSATTSSALTISAAPPATTGGSGGGGGGGAMELGWLLGWLASVIGVWVVTPRRGRR